LPQLRAARPDLIVEHLGELQEILERNEMRLRPAAEPMTAGAGRPVPTVGALIFDGADRVLMIRTHKWSNLWGIPGGKIEFGETAEEALRREIREETNLEIDEIRFVLVQDCIHSPEFYRDAHFVLLNYTCRRAGAADVRLNDEALEFRWVPLAEAGTLRLNEPTRIPLAAGVEGRPQARLSRFIEPPPRTDAPKRSPAKQPRSSCKATGPPEHGPRPDRC